jgi:hypothetical protein
MTLMACHVDIDVFAMPESKGQVMKEMIKGAKDTILIQILLSSHESSINYYR